MGRTEERTTTRARTTPPLPPSSRTAAHLEVELGGNAHEEGDLQVVVEGEEGLGRCTARDHVHHRRLDLEEPKVVKEAAEVLDDLGPVGSFVSCVRNFIFH